MPLDNDGISELKALIGVSRKRELNFGLSLGKKPEDCAFIIHRTKEPTVLMRTAKKADGVEASKSTCGQINTKGKVISLTCIEGAPGGMARKCKQFFAAIGMSLKVRVLDADGAVLEEDGDGDEDDGDEGGGGEDTSEAAQWAATRAKAEPSILSFVSAGQGDVSRVRTAWQYACQAADKGDYDPGARARAISTYQFRSPYEWFSELYAAYHSKKLKDTHPSVAWAPVRASLVAGPFVDMQRTYLGEGRTAAE